MKIAYSLVLPFVFLSSSAFAETLRGRLEKIADGYVIQSSGLYKIQTSPKILASLASLEAPLGNQSDGKKYPFAFEGSIKNDVFNLTAVPTKVSGVSVLKGILQEDNGQYSISGQKVSFGQTKVLNGYEFDKLSRSSFVGSEVIAEGELQQDRFVIDGLAPASVFTMTENQSVPSEIEQALDEVGPRSFLLEKMAKNEFTQSSQAFRVSVAGADQVLNPGDRAFIITMSGRQGDSFGAVNGHFAAGLGTLSEDLILEAEVSNAYVTNEKDILSGNTSLMSYYYHLIQGQNNYRPTFTLVAYGVDAKILKQFRDNLEEAHNEFRSKNIALTPQFNCTTETVKALEKVGIKGIYSQWDNIVKGIITAPLALKAFGDNMNLINFSLKNDPSRYQPRAAYNSFAKAFLSEKFRQRNGIKRVDFIFTPQTPSQRPIGGIALGNIFQAPSFSKLEKTYEIEGKLSPEELKPLLEEHLQKIK